MVIVRLPLLFGPLRARGDTNAAIFDERLNKSNRYYQ
jgi:hypothetical protein